jgi:hypothetical protein
VSVTLAPSANKISLTSPSASSSDAFFCLCVIMLCFAMDDWPASVGQAMAVKPTYLFCPLDLMPDSQKFI